LRGHAPGAHTEGKSETGKNGHIKAALSVKCYRVTNKLGCPVSFLTVFPDTDTGGQYKDSHAPGPHTEGKAETGKNGLSPSHAAGQIMKFVCCI